MWCEGTQGEKERYVLLHGLGKVLHDRIRLRDELLTVFVAGRDITTSLLSSMFFTLARKPSVWLRLRAEVEQLKGEKPTFEQLMQMRCFKCGLNESEFDTLLNEFLPLSKTHLPALATEHRSRRRMVMRTNVIFGIWSARSTSIKLTNLHSSTRPLSTPPSECPRRLQGHHSPTGGGPKGVSPVFVPAGTKIEFHVSALHRSKDIWGEDAEDFRPERRDSEKSSASWVCHLIDRYKSATR